MGHPAIFPAVEMRGFSCSAAALLAGLSMMVVPAVAQHTTGHTSGGQSGGARSMGTPMRSGPRINPVRPSTYGASSAPPPSWELPRTVTPHWEIPSYIPIQPNPVQGNPVSHRRGGYGVGFVGVPYYAAPLPLFDTDMDEDTAQQAGPQDYAPQNNGSQGYGPQDYGPPPAYGNGGANQDEGYPAARPPYSPAYAAPPESSNSFAPPPSAAADDGLDHPGVTLVFNDGRPPMKVQSYVLTGSSVFVAEHGKERVIPVSELDLPETVAQNREAGVDFQLPGTGR